MNELKHYGTPRKSGRYPWGSGENPYQSNVSFLGYVNQLKKEGISPANIAKGLGITTLELRAKESIAKAEVRQADRTQVLRLKDKGYSNVAIGKKMGKNESSIRSLLDPVLHERSLVTFKTADMLQAQVDKVKYLDIGIGIERHLGISKTKLDTSIAVLKEKGYKVQFVDVEQLGVPGNFTTIRVLTPPDVEYKELFANQGNIKSIVKYTEDGGKSWTGLEPPKSIDSSRIKIVYNEDGGKDKDGVLELRPGVDELSLGSARYAQVRVGVDGTHYMKGMAIYSDDLPDGIDILYNTAKKRGTPPGEVFKKMERGPDGEINQDNPFGSIVRQKHYIDTDGNKELSALNIMGYKEGSGEEGHWNEWSKTLSSQMLSKQPVPLAKQQLGIAYDAKKSEYEEIMALTNDAVKRRLLLPFADSCDSAAVHLKAAALPRQRTHVLLPLPGIKETEVYAPNYMNGERVVLIRHPHGGKFEIPELIVNNKYPPGKKILGQAKDAIGIHPKVAERLSGADFDGDTVLVIPNSSRTGVKVSARLDGLKNFDPHEYYPSYPGMQKMKKANVGRYMGDISNLITDMTIKGANDAELARAVRHSMVVIDAEKHGLDYKRSHIENGIAGLKTKYQGGPRSGADTLISRASADLRINVRTEITNPKNMTPSELAKRNEGKKVYRTGVKTLIKDTSTMTPSELKTHNSGKRVYRYVEKTYVDKKGKTIYSTTKTTPMAYTDDAFTLSSGTEMEKAYAVHANKLKALGNQARKSLWSTPPVTYDASAKKAYAQEVATLNNKLNTALKNAPVERQALVLANKMVKMQVDSNPELKGDKDALKKVRTQALNEARVRTGAGKTMIDIQPREWEAIQAGAISNNKLNQILNNTNLETVKTLATPRTTVSMTPAMSSRAIAMMKRGATQAEVASALGVSVTTISKLDF